MEKLKELFAFLFPAFFTKINNKQKNFKNPLTNPENYDTIIERMHHGPLVKRLRHGPLKAETGVRFSHGSPQNEAPQARCFFRSVATRDRTSSPRQRRRSSHTALRYMAYCVGIPSRRSEARRLVLSNRTLANSPTGHQNDTTHLGWCFFVLVTREENRSATQACAKRCGVRNIAPSFPVETS